MNSDQSNLLAALEPLYTAVVADVLDTLGYRHQVLNNTVRPLTPALRLCGVVYPVRAIAVQSIAERPYELEIAAVEAMTRGDVLVLDAADNQTCGLWGELLTTACLYKGVRGVVMTACTRDLWKIKELAFPVFGVGYHPADSKGRVDFVSIGEPIGIAGVQAKRGDLILADEDGVVIVPSEVAANAIRLAAEKVAGENLARIDLERGMPMGEVFRKHQIL
ncbi:MAG TPA: RraA family protein [Pirellulaceae bacterium]|nr:RraA family protein [Pirellulaceae bacterium]